jgi:DNA-binding CsgD family transcriptional regulator
VENHRAAEISQLPSLNFNLIVRLGDRRGRLLWSSDTPTDSPRDSGQFLKLVGESSREEVQEKLSQCIVFGRPGQLICEASRRESDLLVPCQVTLLPVDVNSIAICAISSALPLNYQDFDEQDVQVLRLLADDCSLGEVAEKMHRSQSAIEARIKNLKAKLGKKTIGGLVAAALRNRLI